MKHLYLFILFLTTLLISCVNDKSSMIYPENNTKFSEITVSSPTDTISADLGQAINFTPNVVQSRTDQNLQFKWTGNRINSKGGLEKAFECGNELSLNYSFLEKGFYKVTLEVSNDSYVQTHSWIISIRVYDNGYFVCGNKENGDAYITFARDLSATDLINGETQEFAANIVATVNPQYQLKNILRIGKSVLEYGDSKAYLYFFTKDKIYIADPETFEIFYVTDFKNEYPEEEIVSVNLFDNFNPSSMEIATSKNRMVQFNRKELGLSDISTSGISNIYSDKVYLEQYSVIFGRLSSTYYWVNKSKSKVYTYIPYIEYASPSGENPVSNTYGLIADTLNTGEVIWDEEGNPNPLKDYTIVNLFQFNGDAYSGQNGNLFVIGNNKTNKNDYRCVEYQLSYSNAFTLVNTIDMVVANCPLSEDTKLIPNGRYSNVLFSNQSKVYVWNILGSSTQRPIPTMSAIDFGNGKEVTYLGLSSDMKEVYIGVYDENSSNELKGSFYIYDASKIGQIANLKPKRQWENIAPKIVDICYKTLAQTEYSNTDD